MRTSRLEAFSDGVLAIIITIMVLELRIPQQATLAALGHSATGFASYALSYVYVGIYWSNHHHMFNVVDRVSGGLLWANLNLLFWLSLLPFTTSWVDETGFAQLPMVTYGAVLLLAAIAYYVLQLVIFRGQGGQRLRRALGRDLKGKFSPVIYVAGIGLAWVTPWLSMAAYTVVALIWLVPDRRVERLLQAERATET